MEKIQIHITQRPFFLQHPVPFSCSPEALLFLGTLQEAYLSMALETGLQTFVSAVYVVTQFQPISAVVQGQFCSPWEMPSDFSEALPETQWKFHSFAYLITDPPPMDPEADPSPSARPTDQDLSGSLVHPGTSQNPHLLEALVAVLPTEDSNEDPALST